MAAGIFISYRRDESRHAAGRLAEDLSQAFGAQHIFRDIEGIELGVEFGKALEKALAACSVMLVLIGPQWLNMPDHKRGGRRLDQADDWIRQEIATALQRDVRVVPVLLEGAALPDAAELPADIQPLVRRQAMELADVRWRGDLQRLVDALAKLPGFELRKEPEPTPRPAPPPPPAPAPAPSPWAALFTGPKMDPATRKKWWWGVGVAMLLGAVISAMEGQNNNRGGNFPQQPAPPYNLPSGYGMETCRCPSMPNPAMVAPEPRCASGQVRAQNCAVMCPSGQMQLAYVCM